MSKAPEVKTKANDQDVVSFLNQIEDLEKKSACFKILEIMERVTQQKAKMWGSSIVGFGTYRQQYANGSEADWLATGFSPRKQNITVYIMPGFAYEADEYQALLGNLGKFKTGKSCLYIKKIEDIDLKILEKMIIKSLEKLKEKGILNEL